MRLFILGTPEIELTSWWTRPSWNRHGIDTGSHWHDSADDNVWSSLLGALTGPDVTIVTEAGSVAVGNGHCANSSPQRGQRAKGKEGVASVTRAGRE